MIIVFVLIGIYTFFFTRISFFKYDNFIFGDFDLAHHAQQIWNTLHGSLDSSILGIKFLGNHVHLIEFLIAPIYALFPTPKTLLFLQTLFLALGAWPLYLIAKRNLDKKAALVISFAYLFYPALGYVNLFEFHPQALAVFFLLFTFYFFEKENTAAFLIFIFLSLICQENIALVIIMFGFYALALKRKIKWAAISFVAGIIWFVICVFLVLPYFNRGEVGFYNIYGHLGRSMPEIAVNILLHPIRILRFLINIQNAVFLFQLLAPAAFLPLLSTNVILFFIPSLLQHLLSQRISEHTIYYQYTIEIIPFIFIAMVYGLKRFFLHKIFNDNQKAVLIAIVILVLLFNLFLGPHFTILTPKANFVIKNLTGEKDRFINLVPPRATVVATFEFLSHLANREKLYSFHHVYMGKHTLSSKDYILPSDTEYALIDFSDPLTFQGFYAPNGDSRIRKFLEEGKWGVVEAAENIILFKRGRSSSFYPYRITKDSAKGDNYLTLENGEIAFFDYQAHLIKEDGRRYIKIKMNYKCLKPTNKSYTLGIQIIDQYDQMVHGSIHPINYGIYPSQRWIEGENIEEVFNLPWPNDFKAGKYKVKLVVFNSITHLVEYLSNKENNFQVGEIE